MEEEPVEKKTKMIAEGLMKAIQAERYGYGFYMMAANSTQDPKGKEVFETLAQEETDHMRFLQAQYRSILETGKPDEAVKLGKQLDLSGMSPIFSDDLKSRIGEAHLEMTSLSIGVQLEHDAMQYYQSQSDAAEDSSIKKFYARLADWEQGHYQALLRQQEELKQDYWSAGGFAPM